MKRFNKHDIIVIIVVSIILLIGVAAMIEGLSMEYNISNNLYTGYWHGIQLTIKNMKYYAKCLKTTGYILIFIGMVRSFYGLKG